MEFEVNLLKKKHGIASKERGKRRSLIILLAILTGLGLLTFLSSHSNIIRKNTARVVTSGQQFRKISLEKEKVSNLSDLLQQLEKQKITWSDKLRCLSLTIPERVFLTSLEFQKETSQSARSTAKGKDKLVLRGVVISVTGEDLAHSLQEFMTALKDNPTFMSGFQDPILVVVNKSRKEDDPQEERLNFEVQLPKSPTQ
jgi:hypothetical protein